MERTRLYYEAQGFDRPYQWATHEDIPFTRPQKSLGDSTLSVVTTGARYHRAMTDPRFVDSGEVSSLPSCLYGDDLAWDKDETHLNDLGSYLPVEVLSEFVASGSLGGIGSRFHCIPTEYSQRRTKDQDAPEILKRCREDGADLALLIPL